jgi:hypothetical protein
LRIGVKMLSEGFKMLRFGSIVATTALLLSGDVSGIIRLRTTASERVEFPPSENLPVLPDMSADTSQAQDHAAQHNAPDTKPGKSKDEPLQPESRLDLVRFVSGEFARVVQPIPAGKKGFHMKAGVPLDEKELRQALGSSGSAINPGDKAQITGLEFKDHEIVVDINGGGRGKKRLRDRIHLEVGGVPTMRTSQPETPVDTNAGATVYLDFGKQVPDMTPDELKQYLSAILDFSKQHSAAVQWVETLPPDIQNAIKDKRPAVGMDREMVVAALGRPDRKVREKTPEGSETEDWIYGKPPAKTVFVKFDGDKVIQVQQFPQ